MKKIALFLLSILILFNYSPRSEPKYEEVVYKNYAKQKRKRKNKIHKNTFKYA